VKGCGSIDVAGWWRNGVDVDGVIVDERGIYVSEEGMLLCREHSAFVYSILELLDSV
jgi:hypothetical protein